MVSSAGRTKAFVFVTPVRIVKSQAFFALRTKSILTSPCDGPLFLRKTSLKCTWWEIVANALFCRVPVTKLTAIGKTTYV